MRRTNPVRAIRLPTVCFCTAGTAPLVQATKARDHRVFAGKLDKSRLNFGERAIVMALRAPEGDFRDWEDVRTWASSIADSLGRGRARGGRSDQ